MKKIIAMFAVMALGGYSLAQANLLGLGEIKADGSFEISGQQADNETDLNSSANDARGRTATRLRVGLAAEVTEDVNGRVEVVRTPSAAGGQYLYGTGGTNVTTEETALRFQNAYLDIKEVIWGIDARVGRQYVGDKDDLVMYYGPLDDDSLTVNALDAINLSKKIWLLNVNLVSGKQVCGTALAGTNATGAGDTNVSALRLSSDELIPSYKVPLELGYYNRTINNTAASNDNNTLGILDLRASVGLMEDAVKVALEYGMNSGQLNGAATGGKARDYKGNLLDLKVNYDNADMKLGAYIEYANASGDDPNSATAIDSDDSWMSIAGARQYGEILGKSDVLGVAAGGANPALQGLDTGALGRGLNVIALGVKYTPPILDDKAGLSLDYITAKVNEVVTGGDKDLGNEIDLAATYAKSKNVGFKLGYATLSPGKGLGQIIQGVANPTTDSVTKLFANATIKWGGEEK